MGERSSDEELLERLEALLPGPREAARDDEDG